MRDIILKIVMITLFVAPSLAVAAAKVADLLSNILMRE